MCDFVKPFCISIDKWQIVVFTQSDREKKKKKKKKKETPPYPVFRMLDLALGRDSSPDSVIFTGESNFSMFSSTSASVGRCSFTSDAPPDQNLVGMELLSGGPQPDPNKTILVKKNGRKEKDKEVQQKLEGYEAEETIAADSARISFSRALKECREKRLRSENRATQYSAPPEPLLHSSVSDSSARLESLKQPSSSTSTQRSRAFLSPGTPNYRYSSGLFQKGWSSEHVSIYSHMMNNRRNPNSAAAAAALFSGKALPSKWEDAERWIFSPVSGSDSLIRNSFQRRPKSKSGPLGPPGSTLNQMFSPAVHIFENVDNCGKVLAADSPFSAAGQFVSMARSVSIHGCTETAGESAFTEPRGDKFDDDGPEESGNQTLCPSVVSRRDMATQMSPVSSNHTSSGRISSFSITASSILPELHSMGQADMPKERVTMTRWSKKKCVMSVDTSKSISKIQREEARISSWENLQKAKAEASIRKLEMKLEKKRSSSMAKIMSRLRAAQNKAQVMRSSIQTREKFGGSGGCCFMCSSHF